MKRWVVKSVPAIWLLFTALCGVLAGLYLSSHLKEPFDVSLDSYAPSGEPKGLRLLEDEENTAKVYSNSVPGVVMVSTIFGLADENSPRGNGSGFFWDDKGHVVTTFHVVEHAVSIVIHTYDGKSYSASVKGKDRLSDLAVLEITDFQGVPEPLILTNENVVTGQKSIIIGFPLAADSNMGFDKAPSVTTGIISAVDRSIPINGPYGRSDFVLENVLQTDAAINPGNSGGPLLNSAGKVVGMVTGVMDWSTGVGFAVPAEVLLRIIPELIEYGDLD